MDPPTSSSSSGIKCFHDAPSTPTTKNASRQTSSPRSKLSPKNTCLATINSPRPLRSSTLPIHRSRNIAKIIKGEIHNVLTVMRSDPRYYTTGGDGGKTDATRGSSRFEYEERHEVVGMSRFWSNSGSNSGFNSYRGMMKRLDSASNTNWSTAVGSVAAHPILQGLRDLYDLLSSYESNFIEINDDGDEKFTLNSMTFVSPFAAAVCSPDVDAKTTGAALSALHKFIVYGFIGGHNDMHWPSGNSYADTVLGLSSSSDAIQESITVVAQCIRRCSFEGTATNKTTGGSRRMLRFWSFDRKEQKPGSLMLNPQETSSGDDEGTQTTTCYIPQFLLQPRRQRSSNGNSTTTSSISDDDENVVLKLLSLSVQVLRCPAGKIFLSPSDIIGIFDTCLFVSLAAGEARRSLLRSAAADALSHCVIVVCGMRAGSTLNDNGKHVPPSQKRGIMRDDDTGEPTTEDVSDSDDEWGERDPTKDMPASSFLVNRAEMMESSQIANEEPNTNNAGELHESYAEDESGNEEPALVAVMARLAAIADPLMQEDDTCVLSLSLINIALETMNDVDSLASKYPRLLSVMQNDLCRNLLRLSTSSDLTLLGLALRVIFNLFNGIKHHMKLQLEVFLLSVHLRMLASSTSPTTHQQVWSSSPECRELALESLLEFCREPMLMMDLYLNYDCDINCTNLFETICITLAKVANPEEGQIDAANTEHDESKDERDDDSADASRKPRLNILNRLALEGIIAVIDSIARRCRASANFPILPCNIVGSVPKASIIEDARRPEFITDSGNSASLGDILCINRDFYHDTGEYDFCSLSSSSDSLTPKQKVGYASIRTNSDMSEINVEGLSKTEYHLALRERKIRKRRLATAAAVFNESSSDKDWIAELERLLVLPSPPTPKSIAIFLHSTSKLDKTKIGEYISKGPKEKYPFIEKVLEEFTQLFDFTGMSFSESLRLFLSTFRLPGEAQCIDRLMEAFAKRLYEAHITSNLDDNAEKTMLDPPRVGSESDNTSRSGLIDPPTADEPRDVLLPFRSADAAFILSFSTIMLNTDLHNPSMNDEKRMTLEQFIRNNRGINDGADLPRDFLRNLYFDIKNNEIQVKAENINSGYEHVGDFDGLLEKANDISAPFFTSSHSVCNKFIQAGMHERDMFVAISSATTRAISTVFVQSWDDALVTKALAGLRSSANICAYFGLNEELNEILELLFSWGQDYIASVAKLSNSEVEMVYVGNQKEKSSTESYKIERFESADLDADLMARDLPTLPAAFVSALYLENSQDLSRHVGINAVVGSAAHRGLLGLDCALLLVKNHLSLVDEALPTLLEVLFALRDLDALPPRLSDLDDFADSKGNSLPASTFAVDSLARVNEYKVSLSISAKPPSNAGFLSLLSFGRSSSQLSRRTDSANMSPKTTNPLIKVLRAVSKKASLDQIIMKMNDVNMAKRILSSMLSAMFSDDDASVLELASDPLYQDNAVFVLELAARLLISNRAHSAELLPLFLTKFEVLFSPEQDGYSDTSILGLNFPYLLERIIITILRAVIHLYDISDRGIRKHVVRSMELISKLPLSYTQEISDRLGCGAAIILRGCFFLFESREEWFAITNILDIAAQHHSGRPFVFDGIASLVDYTLPVVVDGEPADTSDDIKLSSDGAEAVRSLLLKFLEGSYNDDLSYKVPSMMYLRRVCSIVNSGSTSFHPDSIGATDSIDTGSQQQGFEWIKMTSIIYNDICLSHDPKTAKTGFESLREVLLSAKAEAISDDQWLAFMRIACTNPPNITLQASRISSLNLIGNLFLMLVPELSKRNENWAQLEELTIEVAKMLGENLRSYRATPLFETTVHTVTNMCNVLSVAAPNIGQGINFCSWVGDTLLSELEKVGACGGVDP